MNDPAKSSMLRWPNIKGTTINKPITYGDGTILVIVNTTNLNSGDHATQLVRSRSGLAAIQAVSGINFPLGMEFCNRATIGLAEVSVGRFTWESYPVLPCDLEPGSHGERKIEIEDIMHLEIDKPVMR